MVFDPNDLWYSSPLLTVTAAGLLLLVLEGIRRNNVRLAYWVSLLGLIGAGVLCVLTYGPNESAFNDSMQFGPYSGYCTMLFLLAAFMTIVISRDYLGRMNIDRTEYYALVLFAVAGMILMASALDLIVLFLGIELMSLCLYVLAGFMRTKTRSNEAALKYFLLGAFATGFLLYGIALIYGTTGTTNLRIISRTFEAHSGDIVFLLGVGMLIMALGFKVAAVPFHMWAPDVYEGAPTSITAFMSTGGKAAAFAAFMAVFLRTFSYAGTRVSTVLAILAAASMIVGNVTALAQSNIKRMLAYSSVAHAGYMLAGIAAGNAEGQIGILFYLAAYVLMNLGAFAVVSLVEGENDSKLTFDDYAGLSVQQPALAAFMALFMFSLAGIPPLAGFFGKYYVFLAAVKAGMVWLAIIGVMTSLVSVYYYLRLVVLMYFREGGATVSARLSPATVTVIALAALLVLQLGIYPSFVVRLAQQVF